MSEASTASTIPCEQPVLQSEVNGNVISGAELRALRASLATEELGGPAVSSTIEMTNATEENELQVRDVFMNELKAEGGGEAKNITDLLHYLPPHKKLTAGGKDFHVSPVVSIAKRNYCVGYVRQEDGRIAPRLFYESQSEGDWRVAPWTETTERGIYLSKGEKFDDGYVRETRLVDDLRKGMRENASEGATEWPAEAEKWLYDKFSEEKLGSRGQENYHEIADKTRLKGLPKEAFRFSPGTGFKTEPGEPEARDQLAALQIPHDIAPDFSAPTAAEESTHPILGTIRTHKVPSTYGNLTWHFSVDQKGDVWVSGITGAKDDANSYGTSREVLLAGVLDNKPLEYATQTAGLENGIDYRLLNGRYVDITPLLANLPVIQEFKAHLR